MTHMTQVMHSDTDRVDKLVSVDQSSKFNYIIIQC